MQALFVLIALSLVVALGFLIAFFWAFRDGQYHDSYTPSVRMLWDDTPTSNTQQPLSDPNCNDPDPSPSE
ncbi:cbb3-type cytochrome oxidase assembly protein CcoS [Pontibacter sp. G13]|uniref:cbb3-type cytochrome oxidase assembly protein CcoS n=1 Tax=Pontibacter sp. G13 TaxID=3074898 RepID=UPI002889C03F|nr:cbb3-type cytochrome oxidase assembly protein CcoS [Pontibacter sp. G13]WNJ16113.1 cbb3-type cytochrome oxidase assembly protein CcoS [Pontibacter sp. G13]